MSGRLGLRRKGGKTGENHDTGEDSRFGVGAV